MYVRCDQQELYTRHNLMRLATPLFLVIYHVSLKHEWLEHCMVGICVSCITATKLLDMILHHDTERH